MPSTRRSALANGLRGGFLTHVTSAHSLTFRVQHERLSMARLSADTSIPAWALGSLRHRVADALSVVCAQSHVPPDVVQTRDKSALGIVGVVLVATVVLLADLCVALAAHSVPVFVISTQQRRDEATCLAMVAAEERRLVYTRAP